MKNVELEQKIIAFCKEHSIDLDLGDIDVWAPPGKGFEATGCHTCVAEYGRTMSLYNYSQSLRAIWSDLRQGLFDCDCEDCQYALAAARIRCFNPD